MSKLGPILLSEDNTTFPSASLAMEEPNGLLAIGGDLSTERLLEAYQHGIFPWYSDPNPIMWWSPDPRTVLLLDDFKVSRSLEKTLRNHPYKVTHNKAFAKVIEQCATPRDGREETWITEDMIAAYIRLHDEGYAHSFEVWDKDELVGGLYGITIGLFFAGESMFSLRPDTSKIALHALVEHQKQLGASFIDCQVWSEHLGTLGAKNIPRDEFLAMTHKACQTPA